jgi:hypothetical protein
MVTEDGLGAASIEKTNKRIIAPKININERRATLESPTKRITIDVAAAMPATASA